MRISLAVGIEALYDLYLVYNCYRIVSPCSSLSKPEVKLSVTILALGRSGGIIRGGDSSNAVQIDSHYTDRRNRLCYLAKCRTSDLCLNIAQPYDIGYIDLRE